MKALAPGLLIAMPQLLDPNFERAVVLMLEHGDGGSMGLVINRPAKLSLAELGENQKLEVAAVRSSDNVFIGGPVESYRGFVLHDSTAVGEKTAVLPGLYLSLTQDSLKALLRDEGAGVRFCLGYAGWGPGQVERELQQGSWLFCEAPTNVLTTKPEHLWEEVIKQMGIDPAMLVTTGGVN